MKQSCFLSTANIWHHAHSVTDNNIYIYILFCKSEQQKNQKQL